LADTLLFDKKKSAKVLAIFWLTLSRFGDQFGRKDCGLCSYNPFAEEVFFYEVPQNFELFSNIQDQN
jgi:hypothetical protein